MQRSTEVTDSVSLMFDDAIHGWPQGVRIGEFDAAQRLQEYCSRHPRLVDDARSRLTTRRRATARRPERRRRGWSTNLSKPSTTTPGRTRPRCVSREYSANGTSRVSRLSTADGSSLARARPSALAQLPVPASCWLPGRLKRVPTIVDAHPLESSVESIVAKIERTHRLPAR